MTTDFFVWKIDIQRRKWFVLGEESILTNMSEALLKHIKFQALYLLTAVVGHQFLAICIIPLHRKFKSLKQRFSLIKSLMCISKLRNYLAECFQWILHFNVTCILIFLKKNIKWNQQSQGVCLNDSTKRVCKKMP